MVIEKLKNTDMLSALEDELKLNGFDVRINKHHIEIETIAGKMKFSCSEKNLMANYYRFISHYGAKLYSYGLKNKLKSLKTTN